MIFSWKKNVVPLICATLVPAFAGGCVSSARTPAQGKSFLKDRIYTWGYVLDKVPTSCPFVYGRTRCSLETETAWIGAGKTFYNNSMFNPGYGAKTLLNWNEECFENCIKNKLSDEHMRRIAHIPEVYCTLEHLNSLESAERIARLSLKYPNIKGINIDDFNNGNPDHAISVEMLRKIRETLHRYNPNLKIAVVSYADVVHHDLTPYKGLIDIVSRWQWIATNEYWDNYKADIRKLRKEIGPDVTVIQGIYINDFGSGIDAKKPLPADVYRNSIRVLCENVYDGTIDGIIIPQAGWFSFPTHMEEVQWIKNYIDWADATTTNEVFSLPGK